MTDQTTEGRGSAGRGSAGQGPGDKGSQSTADSSVRREAEAGLRGAAGLVGETLRERGGDFVHALGEALRVGGDTLEKRKYRMVADCFDTAADRVEGLWDEIEQSAGADGHGAMQPVRQRLRANPTIALGAALGAGFLLGAFLRAGLDDPDELP